MPLHRHMSDSACVAQHLYDNFLPASVRDLIAAPLPGGHADASVLCAFIAAVHDIGKATPAFATQVPDLFSGMEYEKLTARAQVRADRRLAPHATAGMIVLDQWLIERHGWTSDRTGQFSVIVGGHHGLPPDERQYQEAVGHPHLLGWSYDDSPVWRRTQFELLDWVAESTDAADRLADWEDVKLPQTVQVVLTGLVIMADWIASNPRLFPFREDTTFDGERIRAGLDALDLTSPWRAIAPDPSENLLTTRFGLPENSTLRPVQEAALAASSRMPAPGLMIIEAPMGEGKTEAALLAAETLASRCGAGGCYIALPTRATSDAMFDRVLEWTRRLPDRDAERGSHSIALAHAKAYFNTAFTRLFHYGEPSAIAQDEKTDRRSPDASLIAHWWMAGRKKTMFNSFVIGTIDQLLFGALKAKHLAMRHLGLACKVVVIDEAHAYDVYMGTYLDMALEWLGAYGVPVVILSATLPAGRRRELMAAYERGRSGPRPSGGRKRRRTRKSEPFPELAGDIGYPAVITGRGDGHADVTVTATSGRDIGVQVHTIEDDVETLIAALRTELAEDGCALVIRNTVRRVQETAAELRRALPGTHVTVAHSRFAAPDRAEKDRRLRRLFGPPGNGVDRPTRHIVVASQVAEQSLDIDFDVLFTDLAPVDLVLQRMGRLHRHERPERTRPARCYLTGADWSAGPPDPVDGSVRVYGRWPLLRSAAALRPYLVDRRSIELPGDIAPLVQDVYGDEPLGPDEWHAPIAAALEQDLEKRADQRHRAEQFRLQRPLPPGEPILGRLHSGEQLDDEESRTGRAMVRDIPGDTIEVLLIVRDGDRYTTLPWLKKLGGAALPTEGPPDEDLAKAVAATTLTLPLQLSSDEVLDELEQRHEWIGSWQDSFHLKGRLILDIDLVRGTYLGGHHLDYDDQDGLRVRRL